MRDLYLEILEEFIRGPEDVEQVVLDSGESTRFMLELLGYEEKPKTIH